jgi:hypothetical protein
MIVLHLQCRNDGAVRAVLQKVEGHFITAIASRLLFDTNAKAIYEAIFAKAKVERIHVRVFLNGEGWVNPQRINE